MPADWHPADVESPAPRPRRWPRLRRWRRRALIALASFTLFLAVLGTGAYYARAYVFPSWPPWAYARLIRPVEGWLRSVPVRLHLARPAQQRDQRW
jgi:hypothetical protein